MSRARVFLSVVAAATLAGCGGDSNSPNPPSGGGMLAANEVSIVLNAQNKGTGAFTPNPITISLASATGGAVKWINNDENTGIYGGGGTTHNITADDGSSFISGNIAPGATFQTTLTPGNYPYHCSIHPTMKGTVIVTQ
jgi:plastocyanin